MNKTIQDWLAKRENIYLSIQLGLVFLGLILTAVSWTRICSSSCAQVHEWKILGFPFELGGLLFFLCSGAALFISQLRWLLPFLVAGAVGAELHFLYLQKFIIGQWCPICLTIAACVGTLLVTLVIEHFHEVVIHKKSKGEYMTSIRNMCTFALVASVGFLFAVLAVFKPESTFADEISDVGKPFFGDASSPIEVYVITDWFCSACKKKEPVLQQMYPKIMREAKLFFIDLPIHKESRNYIPYNLSFMVQNQDKYFQIREKLILLTSEKKEPTLIDVENALDPLGVKVKMLSYAEIDKGQEFFDEIAKDFNVRSTPTVVIASRKTMEAKKIKGSKITEESVMEAIHTLR